MLASSLNSIQEPQLFHNPYCHRYLHSSSPTKQQAYETMENILLHFLRSTGVDVSVSVAVAAAFAVIAAVYLAGKFLPFAQSRPIKPPPVVAGLPLIGNLHQLREKKPHLTFAKWADDYGPIYSIRTGSSTVVVLNSTLLAKEAMVKKFSSISTRKLPSALKVLTCNKNMVAMSDYGEFHMLVKRYVLTSLLGASAQKQFRSYRNAMMENMMEALHNAVKEGPAARTLVNLREIFKKELFSLSLKQALGQDVESAVYVEELGREISKEEIHQILVIDPMMGAIEVDWRDFFPYLSWIPNRKMERKIQTMAANRKAVTNALIKERQKRIALGDEETNSYSYLDFLLSKNTLDEEQLNMLVWEAIIESSDSTLVTTEWAMFELAKHPEYQDLLCREIEEVCGAEAVAEEHLPQLPLLNAIFHETLRYHSPVAIVPPRYVHEDTQLGGYDIPAGTQVAVNLHACNMNKEEWDEPNTWKPERFAKDDSSDLHKTMAFGAGKRVCAGSLQAMLISCVAIGRFVQELEWRLREGDEDKVDTILLTSHKLHPLHAYVTPRRKKQ